MNSTRKEEVLVQMGNKTEIVSLCAYALLGVCFARKDLVGPFAPTDTHKGKGQHTSRRVLWEIHTSYTRFGRTVPTKELKGRADSRNNRLRLMIDRFHNSHLAISPLSHPKNARI